MKWVPFAFVVSDNIDRLARGRTTKRGQAARCAAEDRSKRRHSRQGRNDRHFRRSSQRFQIRNQFVQLRIGQLASAGDASGVVGAGKDLLERLGPAIMQIGRAVVHPQ